MGFPIIFALLVFTAGIFIQVLQLIKTREDLKKLLAVSLFPLLIAVITFVREYPRMDEITLTEFLLNFAFIIVIFLFIFAAAFMEKILNHIDEISFFVTSMVMLYASITYDFNIYIKALLIILSSIICCIAFFLSYSHKVIPNFWKASFFIWVIFSDIFLLLFVIPVGIIESTNFSKANFGVYVQFFILGYLSYFIITKITYLIALVPFKPGRPKGKELPETPLKIFGRFYASRFTDIQSNPFMNFGILLVLLTLFASNYFFRWISPHILIGGALFVNLFLTKNRNKQHNYNPTP